MTKTNTPVGPVLTRLGKERIFAVAITAAGNVAFTEACDDHFEATLSPDDVDALADELRAVAAAARR